MTREAFESDLRREGFEVKHGGAKGGVTEDLHAHEHHRRQLVLIADREAVVAEDAQLVARQIPRQSEAPRSAQQIQRERPHGIHPSLRMRANAGDGARSARISV